MAKHMHILDLMAGIISPPEPKAHKVSLLYTNGSSSSSSSSSVVRRRRPSSTLSNLNISEVSWPIFIKFYVQHHWGKGKAA